MISSSVTSSASFSSNSSITSTSSASTSSLASSSDASSFTSSFASPSSTANAVQYPADIGGGLALWKLTLPVNVSSKGASATEIKQPALASYSSAYFALNSAKTAMVMTDLFGGARTSSGTAYARSELREMTAVGSSAAWDCMSAIRKMTLRQRGVQSPTLKPEMSIGQIHDSSNDNLEIRYIGPKDSNGVGTGMA